MIEKPEVARRCGECVMCCKLLGVTELQKVAGDWCSFVQIGKPQPCQVYNRRMNLWLGSGFHCAQAH